MNAALAQAHAYGVAVRFADLGEWAHDELRAEYDPSVPEIRLNVRVASALSLRELGEFVTIAVAHELYHHREHIGEVGAPRDRASREAAAGAFARELLERSR